MVAYICAEKTLLTTYRTMDFILFISIGGIAGWISGLLIQGKGFGFLGNLLLGVLGAVFGLGLSNFIGLSFGNGTFSILLNAILGASLTLLIANHLFSLKNGGK